MKKYPKIIITLCTFIALVACDSANKPSNTNNINSASKTINGVYFNANTEMVLLIDSLSTDYPIILHNYSSASEKLHMHFAKSIREQSDIFISSSDVVNRPEQLVRQNNFMATLSGTETIIVDLKGSKSLNTVEFTRQSTPKFDELLMDANDEIGTRWTINADKSFSVKLNDSIADNCIFSGTLEDTNRGYWIDKNTQLNAGCTAANGNPLFNTTPYTARLYSFEHDGKRYMSASIFNNDDPDTLLRGGLEVPKVSH